MNNFRRPNRPDLLPTRVPTAIDIAWAAGIYEGEGSCHLCGGNKKTGKIGRGLEVGLPQKDPEFLYWLRAFFGGSIGPNGKKGKCFRWHVCGDSARIFLSLIYKFLTARRKQQVDVTGALDYLEGESPCEMSIEQLNLKLRRYYELHDLTTPYGNPHLMKKKRKELYERKMTNEEFRRKQNDRFAKARAKRSPEQVEAARKYARDYYQKKKQKLHLVEMQKSA
jgi:hypothetical protein